LLPRRQKEEEAEEEEEKEAEEEEEKEAEEEEKEKEAVPPSSRLLLLAQRVTQVPQPDIQNPQIFPIHATFLFTNSTNLTIDDLLELYKKPRQLNQINALRDGF
jgi:hypothetical protein